MASAGTKMAVDFLRALNALPADDPAEREARLRQALVAAVEGLVDAVLCFDMGDRGIRDDVVETIRLVTAALGPREEILDKMKREA